MIEYYVTAIVCLVVGLMLGFVAGILTDFGWPAKSAQPVEPERPPVTLYSTASDWTAFNPEFGRKPPKADPLAKTEPLPKTKPPRPKISERPVEPIIEPKKKSKKK